MNKTGYKYYKNTLYVIDVIIVVLLVADIIYCWDTLEKLGIPYDYFIGAPFILQKLVDKRNNKTNRSTYKTTEL